MKAVSKLITGAATAALIAVGAAAPAEAQYRDRYRDRDRGIDAGDIITGIAVLGGIAAVTNALGRDYGRYGYGFYGGFGGFPPTIETRECDLTITLTQGRMQGYMRRGNDCRALPPDVG